MWLMGAAALWAGLFDAQAIDDMWERALVGALGLATLAGAWWFAPMIDLEFDRAAGSVRFTEIRILRSHRREFPLTPQTRVAQEADHDEGARLTRLVLHSDVGVAPLERGYGSGDRNAIEAEINDWLKGAGGAPSVTRAPGGDPRSDDPSSKSEPTVRRRR
jgi:hypothetical protein